MILRLLCNENVPRALVEALRSAGHDVAWVAATMAGATDPTVLRTAADQQRICVTFDKDFGELAARTPSMAVAGIILLRVPTHPPQDAARRIATLIGARTDWAGHFSVIEPQCIRMRRIGTIST